MQRYTVFINEHRISFGDNQHIDWNLKEYLYLSSPSEAELQHLIHFLLDEPGTLSISLADENTEELQKRFNSIFTLVEAAGGVVFNQKEEVLCIHRLGKWDFPKGKIEENESREAAAIREVEEECGVNKLKIRKRLPTSYHVYKWKDQLILKPTYWFEMSTSFNGNLIPQTEEDIDRVSWLSKEEVLSKYVATYPSLKEIVGSLFNS